MTYLAKVDQSNGKSGMSVITCMFCLFWVNLIRCKSRKVTCHYPKEGVGVVNTQPIVIIFFVTTRGEGEGGRRGRANVTIYGVFLWMASLSKGDRQNRKHQNIKNSR